MKNIRDFNKFERQKLQLEYEIRKKIDYEIQNFRDETGYTPYSIKVVMGKVIYLDNQYEVDDVTTKFKE